MLLLSTIFAVVQLLRPAPAKLLQVDSPSYLAFAPTRTGGYPLFLHMVETLPGGLHDLPAIQLGLCALAATFLCVSFRRLLGCRTTAALLLVLLLGNPQVTRLSFMIMTESMFLSCLMVLIGLFCRILRRPRATTLAWASLVAGMAVLIRPAGYALAVSLPLLALWCRRGAHPLIGTLPALALPYLAALGLGMAAYHGEHGLWRTQTLLGKSLLGKAAAIADVKQPGSDPQAVATIAATVAPDRTVIDKAPTLFDRFRLLVPYYDIWRNETVYDALLAQDAAAKANPTAFDGRLTRISLAVVAAAPGAYLADVALNYAALWWLPDAMTHAELAHFRAVLAALGPLPHLGRYPAWHHEHNDAVIWALRGLMLTAFAASLWWAGVVFAYAVRREWPPPVAQLGFAIGLLVQASFVLTAVVEAALPRYVWAMWPAIAMLFILAGFTGFAWLRRTLGTMLPAWRRGQRGFRLQE